MQILGATAFRASFKSSITNLVHTTLCRIIFEYKILHNFVDEDRWVLYMVRISN